MPELAINPIDDAVAFHGGKRPIASVLRTKGWSQVPVALRQRAQFSAGVESAVFLQKVQGGVEEILGQHQNEAGAFTDRSGLIRDLQGLADREGLGAGPDSAERGTLTDVGSEARLKLIVETQTSQAYGFANWKQGDDADALDAAPAQELTRIRDSKVKRDWRARWAEAGAKVGWEGASQGRMVALKSSPIWTALSRFGVPYPPFDFNSGMWVEDVLRPEAEDLGLITPRDRVEPSESKFNDGLEAGVKGLSPANRQNLESLFGNQIAVDSETVQWKGDASDYERSKPNLGEMAGSQFRGSQTTLGGLGLPEGTADGPHPFAAGGALESNPVEISAVASGRKPLYHEDLSVFGADAVRQAAARLQSQLPPGVVARAEDGHLYVYHQDLVRRLTPLDQPVWSAIKAHREDGAWLGYGANIHEPAREPLVRIWILDEAGRRVQGFRTPKSTAELYAAARARDWLLATGRPHSWRAEA